MLTALKSRLIEDWQWVLHNAWSARLLGISAVLTGGEIALPIAASRVPQGWLIAYSLLTFVVVVAAFVARFIAQKRIGAE